MSGPIQAAGSSLGPIPADIPVPAPLAEVTVTALPERLQQLARTVQIAGQVVTQEDGTATVRTAVGDVVVKTPVPLPTDRPVVLQITPPPQPNAAPPPALVLLLGSPATTPAAPAATTATLSSGAPSVGPPAAGATGIGTPTLAAPMATSTAAAPTLPDLQPGAVIRAVVIQAAMQRAESPVPTAGAPAAVPTAAPTAVVATVPSVVAASAAVASSPPAALATPPLATTTAPPATATVTAMPTPATGTAAAASATPTAATPASAALPAPAGVDRSPSAAPAAAPPPVWAGLPPLARSIPLTAPTPIDNALPPQLAAAASLAAAPAPPEAGDGSPPLVGGRIPPATAGAPESDGAAATAPSVAMPTAAPQSTVPRAAAPQIAMIALGALPEEAVSPPVATATPQPTGASTVGASAAAPTTTPMSLPPAAAPPLGSLRQGATVQLTVVAVGPEAAAPAPDAAAPAAPVHPKQAPALPAGASLSGRLEGITSRGQPVVSTPAGTLLLSARTELPAGTPIQMAATLPEFAVEKPVELAAIDPLQGRSWPALKEVLATLATLDPHLAHSVAQHVLPQPTPKLTTSLLAFLGALRGGNAAGWLGDAATGTLERAGRADLLSRLSDDFRALGLQGQERLVGDWRALTVPFGQMGDVQAFQFAVRQPDPEESGTAAAGRATRRFVIDIEFTRLGAMQLDGLTGAGRFDLVIRSLQLLPGELKRDLLTIFSGSLQAVGFTGQLSFQTGSQQWVKLTPAKRRATQT